MRLEELLDPVEPDEVDEILEVAGPLYRNDHYRKVHDWLEGVSRAVRELDPAVRERARTWARIEAELLNVGDVWEIRQRLRSVRTPVVRFLIVWDEVEVTLP